LKERKRERKKKKERRKKETMESIGVNGINSTSAGTVQYRRVNSYLSEIDITVVDGVSSTITGTVQYREKYNRRFVYQYW
jgi:Flp pilus assembly protein TadG